MNKRLIPVLMLLCILSIRTQAQKQRLMRNQEASCASAYLGFNLGINNPNGLIGISVDIPVVKFLSVNGGIGLSSWGGKYYGELRGYLGQCHRGWAAGAGVSRNTGLTDFNIQLNTTAGNKTVTLDLLPQSNIFINLYRFWTIGKNRNRFYTMTGYSVPLITEGYFKVKSSDILTDESYRVMKAQQPGGIAFGLGWYFDGKVR